MVKYTSASDQMLPESTSEVWAHRVHRLEKWRQMGERSYQKLLESLVGDFEKPMTILTIKTQSLPTDFVAATLNLNQAGVEDTRRWM
jgi:hypothetical protein